MADSLARTAVSPLLLAAGLSSGVEHDAAFTALYESHLGRVYSFVRSHVRSAGEAHELVGRIFVKVYAHWPQAPRGDAAVLWLFRVARNTVIDYWRREGRKELVSVALDELEELPDQSRDPEGQYASKQRKALLLEAVSELDPNSRMLLALKFTAQRTNREIAAILQVSEAAVSMRLLRALRRLRERLAGRGVR